MKPVNKDCLQFCPVARDCDLAQALVTQQLKINFKLEEGLNKKESSIRAHDLNMGMGIISGRLTAEEADELEKAQAKANFKGVSSLSARMAQDREVVEAVYLAIEDTTRVLFPTQEVLLSARPNCRGPRIDTYSRIKEIFQNSRRQFMILSDCIMYPTHISRTINTAKSDLDGDRQRAGEQHETYLSQASTRCSQREPREMGELLRKTKIMKRALR